MCVNRDRLGDRYYGRCVVKLGDPPTLPYRQVRTWGWGAKQYCDCFTRLRGYKLYCVARNERERNPMPKKCYVLSEKIATPTYNPAPTFALPTYEKRE
jgi:hypothetical protein